MKNHFNSIGIFDSVTSISGSFFLKFFFVVFFLTSITSCSPAKKIQQLYGENLYQKWVHAHEEDSGNNMVFRNIDYPLPPSRGRIGMELKKDGTAIYTSIGPSDIPEKTSGKWKLKGKDTLILTLDDATSHSFKLIEVKAQKIVVQKL